MNRFGIEITEGEYEVLKIDCHPRGIKLKEVREDTHLITQRLKVGLNHPNFPAEFMMWRNEPEHVDAHVHKIENVQFGSQSYANIIFSYVE